VRKAVKSFVFLESEKVQEQIRQIFRVIGTSSLPPILSRCLTCNELLKELPREEVRDRVPPYVFETQTHFKCCPSCRRIYWAGTHRQAVLRALQALLREPSSK
jgi:uncharacterized protein with PIN domain